MEASCWTGMGAPPPASAACGDCFNWLHEWTNHGQFYGVGLFVHVRSCEQDSQICSDLVVSLYLGVQVVSANGSWSSSVSQFCPDCSWWIFFTTTLGRSHKSEVGSP